MKLRKCRVYLHPLFETIRINKDCCAAVEYQLKLCERIILRCYCCKNNGYANGNIEVVTYRFLDLDNLLFKKRKCYRFPFPMVPEETCECRRLIHCFSKAERLSLKNGRAFASNFASRSDCPRYHIWCGITGW